MRIALIAPPFIPVPPKQYGGTELFIAHLAEGLKQLGAEVRVYANGESRPGVELKWLFRKSDWPIHDPTHALMKDVDHCSWAVADAKRDCDVLHLNSAPCISYTRLVTTPVVYTVHHAYESPLNDFYRHFPEVNYVTISEFQGRKADLPNSRTIHHGIDVSLYHLQETKQPYLVFLGRIAPMKGAHLAIEVAKKVGMPLKIAGEIQPLYKDYWEQKVKPQVDGNFIEYVGEVDLKAKDELLGHATAMLFPIQWNEPFGLVMVEAMACGTPVLALPGGSVEEIVKDGISGYICSSVSDMAQRVQNLDIPASMVREHVEQQFSVSRMVEEYMRLYEEVLVSSAPVVDPDSKGTVAA